MKEDTGTLQTVNEILQVSLFTAIGAQRKKVDELKTSSNNDLTKCSSLMQTLIYASEGGTLLNLFGISDIPYSVKPIPLMDWILSSDKFQANREVYELVMKKIFVDGYKDLSCPGFSDIPSLSAILCTCARYCRELLEDVNKIDEKLPDILKIQAACEMAFSKAKELKIHAEYEPIVSKAIKRERRSKEGKKEKQSDPTWKKIKLALTVWAMTNENDTQPYSIHGIAGNIHVEIATERHVVKLLQEHLGKDITGKKYLKKEILLLVNNLKE